MDGFRGAFGPSREPLHTHRVVAAVDVQRRAGDVARVVAEQVRGGAGDVAGTDVAVERRALFDRSVGFPENYGACSSSCSSSRKKTD